MATLILTAVGTAVGGPIGGALGALIGQQADSAIFAPKRRQGPRLGELSVQTSSYGTAIPKIFGRMRVAGTVIWSTDLKEEANDSGGGKGAPETRNYSYSASFAVTLSGRRILDVGRIWADGKLLRGAAGDFKSATGFRLYPGDENQVPDPLIVSVEGADNSPAFRGTAYALFEDFQLADYGNRIPSLTFEVEAEEGAVGVGAIAEELSGGEVKGGETPVLVGYAASGDSVRGAIEALADVTPLSLVDEEEALRLTAENGAPLELAATELGADAGTGGSGATEIVRSAAGSVPDEVSIAYHDPARDYQTGLQRATRGVAAVHSDRRALPATLAAAAAKGFAEARMAALWAARTRATVRLGWRRSVFRPGARIRLDGRAGLWKVERWTLERMVTTLDLAGIPSAQPGEAAGANPGRPVGHPDFPHGPMHIRLFDLPLGDETGAASAPILYAIAAGEERGWKRASLTASFNDGESWHGAGSTAAPAVMGKALTVLDASGSALLDLRNAVEVELLHEGMWLEGRSDAALAGGANAAVLGKEIIQFGAAEPLGNRRFRLSRLLRGRRGTEWAAPGHLAEEDFALLEPRALAPVVPPAGTVGGNALLLAASLGDGEPAEVSVEIGGEAVKPPSPVHLKARRLANGDIAISWVRRSRAGWTWVSGRDTPLVEEQESYAVRISGTGFERSATPAQPAFLYTAAMQAEDGATGPLTIEVRQVGTLGISRSADAPLG